jgi:hypothetical protein
LDWLPPILIIEHQRIRFGNLNHAIQGSPLQQQLNRLIVKLAGAHLTTEDRFETKHRGFRQRSPMIIRIPLPFFTAMFADVA